MQIQNLLLLMLSVFPQKRNILSSEKKGTTMGTKMAPTYATLVLGYFEHTCIM